MAIKSTNNKKKYTGLICLLLIAAVLAGLFMVRYPSFQRAVKVDYQNPIEQEDFITKLYKCSYVLYRDLYEKITGDSTEYDILYLAVTPDENKKDNVSYENYDQVHLDYDEMYDYIYKYYNEEFPQDFTEAMQRDYMSDLFENWENEYSDIANYVDYKITDKSSNTVVTNSSKDLATSDEFYEYLSLEYDENGNFSNLQVNGEKPEDFLKLSAEVFRRKLLNTEYLKSCENSYGLSIQTHGPKNCTIAFGITYDNWKNLVFYNSGSEYSGYAFYAYLHVGVIEWFLVLLFVMVLITLFLPLGKEINLRNYKIFKLPLEIVVIIGVLLLSIGQEVCIQTGSLLLGESATRLNSLMGLSAWQAEVTAYIFNFFFVFSLFVLTIYDTLCIREIRECGFMEYIKKRSYIYRFFPYIKKKSKQLYNYLLSFDVSTKSNKIIIRIIIANAIVLTILCFFWISGIALVIIYSIFMYFFLRKYVNDIKKKYNILYEATNKIAEGNLNVYITEDLGLFEPFKPQIAKIQEGFRSAVEEEVKSQRMKTELITNVSHDLKTPLTAIITYINLLKEEGVTEEQRKEYLDTLERKSLRLKVLIEDLFEVSKATSNNITLDIVEMDLVNLLKQVEYEVGDKLKASNLDVRMNFKQEKIVLKLDSQKTYRIYENLFNNVAKYALNGTRVFVDTYVEDKEAVVTIKNISDSEITINPADLTERFVRGDVSRNTEGSGLGLAIAKSFTDIQGGKLVIEADGDLFKVTTVWPLPD